MDEDTIKTIAIWTIIAATIVAGVIWLVANVSMNVLAGAFLIACFVVGALGEPARKSNLDRIRTPGERILTPDRPRSVLRLYRRD